MVVCRKILHPFQQLFRKVVLVLAPILWCEELFLFYNQSNQQHISLCFIIIRNIPSTSFQVAARLCSSCVLVLLLLIILSYIRVQSCWIICLAVLSPSFTFILMTLGPASVLIHKSIQPSVSFIPELKPYFATCSYGINSISYTQRCTHSHILYIFISFQDKYMKIDNNISYTLLYMPTIQFVKVKIYSKIYQFSNVFFGNKYVCNYNSIYVDMSNIY
eukprot:TRINITY_DN92964_c0_g1_i1.p1 TRINITY_DN92964_c0_g1~~TRINITY_DN92964_c0_g1_i1.p1  ORF type:complete len:254 (+),score=-34.45 TRINITY_DN92964_c0_g1_i1:110-763(+)